MSVRQRLTRPCARWILALAAATLAVPAGAACSADSVSALCLAERADAALPVLPADERAAVVATLLTVRLRQAAPAPAALLDEARRLARSGRLEDRLQVLLPLVDFNLRGGDKRAALRQQRQLSTILAQLATRTRRPQAFLQIADVCVGLTDLHGGAPVVAKAWAGLYKRYCQPAFFARLTGNDGFARLTRGHLQLVAHYLVQDRQAFGEALPEMILTLRAVIASMQQQADLPAAEREAGVLIAAAMESGLGTLACLFEMKGECLAILGQSSIPDEVSDPALWSVLAASEAVRGEGLAAGGRILDSIGALDRLLAHADDPALASRRALFLAAAAWLADRVEALRDGQRVLQAT